jgi:arsenate reductase (glutaredoxin)
LPGQITVYQYPACSTCKKALRWLNDRSVPHAAVNIVTSPPTQERLEQLWRASGQPLAAFFNTSGESYRAGGFKDRLAKMSDDEKLAALAADGKLIKRPLLVDERRAGKGVVPVVLVGFREPAYEAAFGLMLLLGRERAVWGGNGLWRAGRCPCTPVGRCPCTPVGRGPCTPVGALPHVVRRGRCPLHPRRGAAPAAPVGALPHVVRRGRCPLHPQRGAAPAPRPREKGLGAPSLLAISHPGFVHHARRFARPHAPWGPRVHVGVQLRARPSLHTRAPRTTPWEHRAASGPSAAHSCTTEDHV